MIHLVRKKLQKVAGLPAQRGSAASGVAPRGTDAVPCAAARLR
ncbi:hypothetical protein [Burkholderia cepacia]|nr:hypothetical protein [Burkholderia cepacia]